jgi:CheY-like chemotaxis protein
MSLCFIIAAPKLTAGMSPKILIVEDDLATRVGLQELLASAGYIAMVAGDFREGRRVLEQECPDLLIVDLRLQGFNGLQLLHINPRPIPTIVVTGFPDDVLQADARRMGAEYLLKPVDPAKLLGLVGRLLDREPQARERRRVPRRAITADLPLEVNAVPARLLDASSAGVRFEIYRPSGQGVPPALTLYFPVHDLQLNAALVWSTADRAGRWQCGAVITNATPEWLSLIEGSE